MDNKKTETPKPEQVVPFFARKVAEREIIVRSGVRAGHTEERNKGG